MLGLDEIFYFENCGAMDLSDLVHRVEQEINSLGFETFFYVGIQFPGQDRATGAYCPPLVTNAAPAGPLRDRLQVECLDSTVLQKSKPNRRPFFWDRETSLGESVPAEQRLISEARRAKFDHGYAFPLHGPGAETALFSVAGLHDQAWFEDAVSRHAYSLFIVAIRTHATITECVLCPTLQTGVRLTAREKQCLLWTVRGKTAWEISQIMGRSSATVNFHLQNAMRKLDAVNKTQAVVKALQNDLLGP